MRVSLFLLSFLLLTLLGYGQEQANSASFSAKMGEGIRVRSGDNSIYLKFEPRFQTLLEGRYALEEDDFTATAQIRRARLKFSGHVYRPGIEYKLELGLSNRDMRIQVPDGNQASVILDAYMRFKLFKELKLRVGQFKMPGNRERIVSSGSLQLVDRSLVNSRFNLDRDVGVMLENRTAIGDMILKQYISVSTGEGRTKTAATSGFMYAGRLDFLPFGEFGGKGDYIEGAIYRESVPKLSLGLSYGYNDNGLRSRGTLGDFLYEERDQRVLSADVMFKYEGFSAFAEFGRRRADNPITLTQDTLETRYVFTGDGMNYQAGYLFKNNWEVAGRFTTLHIDPRISEFADNQRDYTLGVSKYIVGHHLKVQADVTYSDRIPEGGTQNRSGVLSTRISTNLNF